MGLAQHALDLALAATRRRPGPAVDNAIRRALGQACAEVDFMLTGITDLAKRTDEIVFSPGEVLTRTEELRLATANLMAAETLRRVLDVCLELYGSHYVYDGDPMQRVVRDAYVALAHAGAKRMHWGFLGGAVLDDGDGPATLFDEPWKATSL
jgi:alkylation response protein AidB-like acyl-CoA dehydrogenase